MAALLQCVKGLFGPPPGQGVIQDLEYALETKGGLTKEEDTWLQVINLTPIVNLLLFSGLGSHMGWFGLRLGSSLPLSIEVTLNKEQKICLPSSSGRDS
ncbi:unnamed protein product [Urochloa humidicola]